MRGRRRQSGEKFTSEAALCAAFIAGLPKQWTAYAETRGWDILLVRPDGVQIGIQAKLRLNADVLQQTVESYGSYTAEYPGPDFRAVLIPETGAGSTSFDAICAYIGVTVLRMHVPGRHHYYQHRDFSPGLPDDLYGGDEKKWHAWHPAKRCKLPEYVPDVPAGVKAPRQLSDWKIGAIKLAITLERRGYLVRADFSHLSIDHRRFLAAQFDWLTSNGDGRYTGTGKWPDMKAQHPRAYQQIADDFDKWRLPDRNPRKGTKEARAVLPLLT